MIVSVSKSQLNLECSGKGRNTPGEFDFRIPQLARIYHENGKKMLEIGGGCLACNNVYDSRKIWLPYALFLSSQI